MKNSPVGKNKQGFFESVKYRSCQELFDKRNRGAADSYLQDFFIMLKEWRQETDLAEQFSLMLFYPRLINTFMIGKRGCSIDRQTVKCFDFTPNNGLFETLLRRVDLWNLI
jgi:hypothetical protein